MSNSRTVMSLIHTIPTLQTMQKQLLSTTALNVLNMPPKKKTPFGISTSKQRKFTSSSLFPKEKTNKTKPRSIIRPLIVCGPSGVGKGTIISKYMREMGGAQKFGFTVSHTTRNPRPGEKDGRDYHFTDVPSMKDAITNGEFLEYAEVHGNFYGTSLESLAQLERNGKIPLLDIDVQGVKNIKERQRQQQLHQYSDDSPELQAKFIFIAPPSLDQLLNRLVSRGTETEESIKKRTNNAVAEMKYGIKQGNFDAIIVNDDLDEACREFREVIHRLYD